MSGRHCAPEELLAEAEKVVIDFYDIREHVMDIQTLIGDIEAGVVLYYSRDKHAFSPPNKARLR